MERMIDPDRALALCLQHAPPGRTEVVPAADALGLVLAEEIAADRAYPPFARAMMDGYAVRVEDAGRTVRIAGVIAAGRVEAGSVDPGCCFEIMTGAPCPEGTGAVVPREEVTLADGAVALPAPLAAGRHITPAGAECPAGRVVLAAGAELTPLALALLATVGREEVRVRVLPTLAVISTGDELVPAGARPGAAQIRDSNAPMLAARARALGLAGPLVLHARDTAEDLAAALARTADADLLVLAGGVSAGRFDLVPGALVAAGATPVLHKVTQQPGKPLFVARRGPQMIFGLPGNPLSSHFCFHRYVAPVARLLAGRPTAPPAGRGRLTAPLGARSDRHLFLLARVEPDGEEARVTGLLGRGSADLFAAATANAYLRLPPGEHRLDAGTEVGFERIG